MEDKILFSVSEAILAVSQLEKPEALHFIHSAALLISSCYDKGKKVLIAGNGGSLCDASHFAEELTGVFRQMRRALPAIAMNDPGHLTCVGNDLGFQNVFSRGVEALGNAGDCFIGLTTSGNSENLVRAFEAARIKRLKTIAFLGRGGGKLKGVADLEWIVEGFSTSDRVQEAHMAAIHIIIEIVEEHLFYRDANYPASHKKELASTI
jgi:D-sedoheptulose 7-phosphate isomerase